MSANAYQILRDHWASRAADDCLRRAGSPPVSYADMDRLSGQYAATLSAIGVRGGDRVVVQVEKSAGAVALYLACLRIGAVYVPLNVAYTGREVEYFIGDAGPTLLVCRPETEGKLAGAAGRHGVASTWTVSSRGSGTLDRRAADMAPLEEIAPCEPDDVATIVYTSGTTGQSKGAMLTHGNLMSNAVTLHEIWGWRSGDVLLHALPIFHVHGLFVALHCAMLNASPIIFHERFDAAAVRVALRDATIMMGVPTFFTRLLECADFSAADCARMRLFISGSAPLLPSTFAAFERRTGHRILERYGMTEAGMITSNPLDGERVAGTVGYALPEIEVRVTDGDGAPVATDEIGAVEVRGPNVFKGYWGMSDKTVESFRDDGFFVTGDLGRLAADGRLTLVGRQKDLVISGGYNIYPKEIERCLDELPGIQESAVIGVPHSDLGEGLVAVIVAAGAQATDAQLRATLDDRLARFKHPKRFVRVAELPRNAMGKVQKNVLRERYANALTTDSVAIENREDQLHG